MGRVFNELTNWFCLGVGALCLIEGVILARRRGEVRGRLSQLRSAVILCLGVMLAPTSAARLLDWTGTAMAAVTVVSLAAAVMAIAISVRSRMLNDRAAASTQNRS